MAFNPNFYGNYMNNANYSQMQNQGGQMQPQIQNGGFVLVRSETEAMNYPIAFGTSVTFKDETAPYIYSKTMGFSQLDRPIFEKFKLVKEEPNANGSENTSMDNIKNELNRMWAEINLLKERNDEQYSKHHANVQPISTESDGDFVDAV